MFDIEVIVDGDEIRITEKETGVEEMLFIPFISENIITLDIKDDSDEHK